MSDEQKIVEKAREYLTGENEICVLVETLAQLNAISPSATKEFNKGMKIAALFNHELLGENMKLRIENAQLKAQLAGA